MSGFDDTDRCVIAILLFIICGLTILGGMTRDRNHRELMNAIRLYSQETP